MKAAAGNIVALAAAAAALAWILQISIGAIGHNR